MVSNLKPLHELIINYKMALDDINKQNATPFTKLCLMVCLSIDYAEILKGNPEINTNDIEVWGTLTTKYLLVNFHC